MVKSKDRDVNEYILKVLGQKSLGLWVRDALCDWAVIIATFYAVSLWHNPVGYILAVFIIGNRQHALALLGHDGTHYTIHKNKKVNDVISDVLAFWMLGLSTSGYRGVHYEHHKHLNTAHDPELMHRSSKAPQWDLPVTTKKILCLAFLDLFGYSVSDYFMIITSAKPNPQSIYIPMILMNLAFTACFVAAGAYWVPVLWYISVMTSFMMFFRLRTWLEHQGSDDTHVIKLNWLENIILAPHDTWHHYEHHHYPTVPCQRLYLVREKLAEDRVMTLRDLIKKYQHISSIRSGAPLKTVSAELPFRSETLLKEAA